MGLVKKVNLLLYYGFAKKMPSSDSPLSFGSKKIRAMICKGIFDQVGSNINIEKNVFFGGGHEISIGDDSGIGLNARIQGPLTIGKGVMMGPDVLIYTRNHEISRTDIYMIEQGDTEASPVIIEDDVWIGARVVILPGVTIGKGAVVASGAVVSKSIKPYDIVGGVPAKVIKNRLKEQN